MSESRRPRRSRQQRITPQVAWQGWWRPHSCRLFESHGSVRRKHDVMLRMPRMYAGRGLPRPPGSWGSQTHSLLF